MAERPDIRVRGAGSRAEAARIGQDIAAGAKGALAGTGKSLRIDSLRVSLPAGASRADIERALRREVEAHRRGEKP